MAKLVMCKELFDAFSYQILEFLECKRHVPTVRIMHL